MSIISGKVALTRIKADDGAALIDGSLLGCKDTEGLWLLEGARLGGCENDGTFDGEKEVEGSKLRLG